MAQEPFAVPHLVDGCVCLVCKRAGLDGAQAVEPPPSFAAYRLVKVDAYGNQTQLSDTELAEFEAKYPSHAEWKAEPAERTWVKKCVTILKALQKSPSSKPFAVAVDPVALQIPDYPLIIRHPMDLGTIDKKLSACEYKHAEDFISDVRLVFRNAFVYNKQGTWVWQQAEKLSKTFEAKVFEITGHH